MVLTPTLTQRNSQRASFLRSMLQDAGSKSGEIVGGIVGGVDTPRHFHRYTAHPDPTQRYKLRQRRRTGLRRRLTW